MTQTLKPDAYNLDLEPLGPCNSEPLKKSNSSRSQMFFEISSIKNFWNIHRKSPVLGSIFNKVASFHPCSIFKKRLQHRCFLWIL